MGSLTNAQQQLISESLGVSRLLQPIILHVLWKQP